MIPFADYEREPERTVMEQYGNDGWTNLLFVGRIAPNKRQEDLPAFLRIPLSAFCMCLSMQIINLGYVYLIGSPITFSHIFRALLQTLYTAALSLILALPVRFMLGMYKKRTNEVQEGGPA